MGGLSKKLFQIKSLSGESKENRLLLDSGNLLFKKKIIAEGTNQAKLTASTILSVYQDIAYDAVAVGPFDLSAGLAFLQKKQNQPFPWLSANIFDENNQLIFKKTIQKEIQGQDIIITAISAAPQKSIAGIHIKPWEKVIPGLLQELAKTDNNSVIILLSSLANLENQRIAKAFPEIQIIIGADLSKGNTVPHIVNETLLTQTAKQGKYQGVLEILFGNERRWGKDSIKKLADLQNRLGSLNWQLKRLQKKAQKHPEEATKYTASITRLEKETEGLNSQIKAIEKQVVQEKGQSTEPDQFQYRFIPLKKNMPGDQATEETLDVLDQKIRDLHKKVSEPKNRTNNGFLIEMPQSLIGNQGCESCHTLQADFWKTTHHAKAYTTLLDKKKNLDLDCLPCHLTIDFANGGFESLPSESFLSYPEGLRSVGCETCHGSGKKHKTDPERYSLIRVPGPNICLSCHTEEHDDDFNYKTKLALISCPAG